MRHPLLSLILLAMAGCADNTLPGTGCFIVEEGDTCPSADTLEPGDLFVTSTSDCDNTVVAIDANQSTPEPELLSFQQELACCYQVEIHDEPGASCVVGRPYYGANPDGQAPTQAALSTARPLCGPAAAWAEIALGEHASVAAFAKLQLQLMAHGAPPELLAQCAQAMADEVQHTQLALNIASHFAREPITPGPFPFNAPVDVAPSLAQLAADAAREGCVGETLSALAMRRAAEQAADPALQATLTAIADDEDRHAALSWAIVSWAVRTGGAEVRQAVIAAFTQPHPPTKLGLLSADALREVTLSGLDEVINPALSQLLAA